MAENLIIIAGLKYKKLDFRSPTISSVRYNGVNSGGR
jgi:hypothetical protein